MKKYSVLFLIISLWLLSSCDYFGYFNFVIGNGTDQDVKVCLYKQIVRYEDVLPTYNHGEDYKPLISDKDTTIFIEPQMSVNYHYDAGLVGKDFPTESDIPEMYNISPLWERIKYIVVGNDTLAAEDYSKSKWKRSEKGCSCTYTLDISK